MPKVLELPDMNINNEELRLLLAIKLFGNAQRTNQPEGENPSC